MDAISTKRPDRLAGIRRWLSENSSRLGRHPCYAEMLDRIQSIEQLLRTTETQNTLDGYGESSASPSLSLPAMELAMQIDRCEAVIEKHRRISNGSETNDVVKILYPSFSLAVLQQLIHGIVGMKARLGLSEKTYRAVNLLQLFYIKSPSWLTKFVSRFLPKLW